MSIYLLLVSSCGTSLPVPTKQFLIVQTIHEKATLETSNTVFTALSTNVIVLLMVAKLPLNSHINVTQLLVFLIASSTVSTASSKPLKCSFSLFIVSALIPLGQYELLSTSAKTYRNIRQKIMFNRCDFHEGHSISREANDCNSKKVLRNKKKMGNFHRAYLQYSCFRWQRHLSVSVKASFAPHP